ncbi:hypothetical protein HYDPIDRAFT_89232 [Hydnomerulius pinastri MD-312]|uniref:Chromo domain-containing protein n=1 Tax=Hydnomerulius pinastri MD-312 TaxID=994086 RepID=A0A0C9W2I1_9AGAM|nr:hypothetical protein HYDPIDRAFT_89232 [Hydnomerulius pinastri MD-312]
MARATDAVTSDSEGERPRSGSTKKKYSSKKARRASSEGGDVSEVEKEVEDKAEAPTESGEEEGDGEEEEYEIELIIDAKKGQFPNGRMGYFVKWKNYPEEHNSWVDERDAGNAQELIDQYWARQKKKNKPGPRKSEPRGRPRKSEPQSDNEEAPEEDEEEQRAKKKPRKSNGAARKSKKQDSDVEDEKPGTMQKHMSVPSWETLVETIDTVEREADGDLYVFFTVKNEKKRMRENSRLCAQRFPQKLITFYESNLRWKTEEEPAEAE